MAAPSYTTDLTDITLAETTTGWSALGGGGGGSYAVHPGVYVEWPKKLTPKTKMVLVTVKFSEDKVWRHSYTVDGRRADISVKVVSLLNKTTDKISVGVDSIKKTARSVTAIFKDEDK